MRYLIGKRERRIFCTAKVFERRYFEKVIPSKKSVFVIIIIFCIVLNHISTLNKKPTYFIKLDKYVFL